RRPHAGQLVNEGGGGLAAGFGGRILTGETTGHETRSTGGTLSGIACVTTGDDVWHGHVGDSLVAGGQLASFGQRNNRIGQHKLDRGAASESCLNVTRIGDNHAASHLCASNVRTNDVHRELLRPVE